MATGVLTPTLDCEKKHNLYRLGINSWKFLQLAEWTNISFHQKFLKIIFHQKHLLERPKEKKHHS